jgi:hypothetical protein
MPKLIHLKIDHCGLITNKSLSAIACISQLKYLELNASPKYRDLITFAGLEVVFDRCIALQSLKLANHSRINLSRASHLLRSLESLNFIGAVSIQDLEMSSFLKYTDRLFFVDLAHCENIGDDTLVSIAEYCKFLKELNISGCHKATSSGIIKIAESCCFLSVMNAAGCPLIDSQGIMSVLNNCKNLVELKCNSLNIHDMLLPDFKSSYIIEKLSIENGHQMSNGDLSFLSESFPKLKALDLLNFVMFGNESMSLVCHSSFAAALMELTITHSKEFDINSFDLLCHSFPNLISLNFKSCEKISKDCIMMLCASTFRNNLRILCLSNLTAVDDQILELIGLCFMELKCLDVSGCINITDAGFMNLFSRFPNLSDLDISSTNCSDAIIVEHLTKNLSKMKRLGIQNCKNISEDTIAFLKSNYKNLIIES